MTESFGSFAEMQGLQPGEEVTIHAATGVNVQVVCSEVRAGAEFALHNHPHEQFIVVLDGMIEFEIDGQREARGRLGFFYFRPDVPHSAKVVGDAPAKLLEVFAPPRDDYRPDAGPVNHDNPG